MSKPTFNDVANPRPKSALYPSLFTSLGLFSPTLWLHDAQAPYLMEYYEGSKAWVMPRNWPCSLHLMGKGLNDHCVPFVSLERQTPYQTPLSEEVLPPYHECLGVIQQFLTDTSRVIKERQSTTLRTKALYDWQTIAAHPMEESMIRFRELQRRFNLPTPMPVLSP